MTKVVVTEGTMHALYNTLSDPHAFNNQAAVDQLLSHFTTERQTRDASRIDRAQYLKNLYKDNKSIIDSNARVELAKPSPMYQAVPANARIEMYRYIFETTYFKGSTHSVRRVTCEGITVEEEIIYHDVSGLGRRDDDPREFQT